MWIVMEIPENDVIVGLNETLIILICLYHPILNIAVCIKCLPGPLVMVLLMICRLVV